MNYLIGFVIFAGGLSIIVDPAPPINIFGIPKGDTIPYGLNIPVGSVMALLGLLFIYRELKKSSWRVANLAFKGNEKWVISLYLLDFW